jgi:hypothetical protein
LLEVKNDVRKTHTIPLNFLSKIPVNPTPNYKLAEIFQYKEAFA